MFFFVFVCFVLFKCRVFVVVKTKTYKITNMMHFAWAKTPFPGQSECFVAVLLTLFFDASYLNGYCSLMFLCMFLMCFIKVKNMIFYVFFICN